MNIGFGLNLEQTQKLIMTTELKQAIQLLQYTSIELNDYITSEMEVNPLLEFDQKKEKSEEFEEKTKNDDKEIDWQEYANQYDDISYSQHGKNNDNENSFENMVAEQETLRDYLIHQLRNNYKLTEDEFEIGSFIIESLDSNGYLSFKIENIAEFLGKSVEEIENMLYIIQSCEPVGVGCRNLKECLLLQVERDNESDPKAREIIEDYLEDIASNKVTQVAKKMGLEASQVQVLFDYIKTLQPKPGSGFNFSNEEIKFIQPDVELKEIDGEMVILVKDSAAPRLRINDFYRKMLQSQDQKEVSEFISEKLNSAAWLIKTIEQRRSTIQRVAEAIYKRQVDFFKDGKQALKPMTLRDIAEEIEMHESTVSRATNGKYILTPKGTYELKYFFSTGLSQGSGGSEEEISTMKIKMELQKIVEEEDTKKPLSDQKIVSKLKENGFTISRRTVAKYREELGILSSSKRKRFD
ncbi:MAG: RNA polymerase factor sigma-54 [Tissierellales bacterium]|jgi:RNA polymerase sigma-54 factor|nr:RNA polymerase factor sigma-54 [Tissierellales bacterium]